MCVCVCEFTLLTRDLSGPLLHLAASRGLRAAVSTLALQDATYCASARDNAAFASLSASALFDLHKILLRPRPRFALSLLLSAVSLNFPPALRVYSQYVMRGLLDEAGKRYLVSADAAEGWALLEKAATLGDTIAQVCVCVCMCALCVCCPCMCVVCCVSVCVSCVCFLPYLVARDWAAIVGEGPPGRGADASQPRGTCRRRAGAVQHRPRSHPTHRERTRCIRTPHRNILLSSYFLLYFFLLFSRRYSLIIFLRSAAIHTNLDV